MTNLLSLCLILSANLNHQEYKEIALQHANEILRLGSSDPGAYKPLTLDGKEETSLAGEYFTLQIGRVEITIDRQSTLPIRLVRPVYEPWSSELNVESVKQRAEVILNRWAPEGWEPVFDRTESNRLTAHWRITEFPEVQSLAGVGLVVQFGSDDQVSDVQLHFPFPFDKTRMTHCLPQDELKARAMQVYEAMGPIREGEIHTFMSWGVPRFQRIPNRLQGRHLALIENQKGALLYQLISSSQATGTLQIRWVYLDAETGEPLAYHELNIDGGGIPTSKEFPLEGWYAADDVAKHGELTLVAAAETVQDLPVRTLYHPNNRTLTGKFDPTTGSFTAEGKTYQVSDELRAVLTPHPIRRKPQWKAPTKQ